MNKSQIIDYWLAFFRDLLLGTLKKLFLSCFIGLGLGVLSIMAFDSQILEVADWSNWLEILLISMASIWYLGFGVLHGVVACALQVMIQKIREALEGLQQLLDWLTREVINRIPKFQKNIPKHELAQKYDQIGDDLRQRLKQRGGITGFTSSLMFGVILKVLRFFFLDEVVEELHKKDKEEITSADIEHAVRRVGTEVMIAPITDNLFLLQIINIFIGLM
jgi:hypothetical protein